MLEPLSGCDLPIFVEIGQAYALFYAPGCIVVTTRDAASEFTCTLANPFPHEDPGEGWAAALRQCAARAVRISGQQQNAPFQPECLTLYLHNECNLSCTYCYAGRENRRGVHLAPDAIATAAELVATSCRAKGLPLTVAFHGGGEPTLFQAEVAHALTLVADTAQRHGLAQFRYVATNGVISEKKARWLAAHFDLVGLSCDGPPEIQDQQRPTRYNRPTSPILERTADIFHQLGHAFHVRATITSATFVRQEEIAEYICARLRPEEIHFEPVYQGGRATSHTETDRAGEFVEHFLTARELARRHGIAMTYAGARPGTIHGPYCNIFRQVVNLVPPGAATACFKTVDMREADQESVTIGTLRHRQFEIDGVQVTRLQQAFGSLPDGCAACFNRYHCARGCPDNCTGNATVFRCAINKQVANALLREQAEVLWAAAQSEGDWVRGITL